MNAIEIIQPIGGTLYLATITTVGVRLIVLARRHRGWPELLLGLSLLLGGSLGAVLEVAGISPDIPVEPRTAGALLAVGKALVVAGYLCQLLFIRLVFRPHDRWATALVAAMIFLQLGTFAGFASAGSFGTGRMPTTLFLVELAGRVGGSVWLVAESLRYYTFMRRRLALDLAEPLVTDRFRLWAIAGVAGLVMLATSAPPVVTAGEDAAWVSLLLPVFAVSGIAASGAYLLAFFPPAWYRRHVRRRLGGDPASASA